MSKRSRMTNRKHSTIANELELFVKKAVEACQRTIVIPYGEEEITCYDYRDLTTGYHSWGVCSKTGIFSCYSNRGRDHLIGMCNLKDVWAVSIGLERKEFKDDLKRFLEEQIRKVGIAE